MFSQSYFFVKLLKKWTFSTLHISNKLYLIIFYREQIFLILYWCFVIVSVFLLVPEHLSNTKSQKKMHSKTLIMFSDSRIDSVFRKEKKKAKKGKCRSCGRSSIPGDALEKGFLECGMPPGGRNSPRSCNWICTSGPTQGFPRWLGWPPVNKCPSRAIVGPPRRGGEGLGVRGERLEVGVFPRFLGQLRWVGFGIFGSKDRWPSPRGRGVPPFVKPFRGSVFGSYINKILIQKKLSRTSAFCQSWVS